MKTLIQAVATVLIASSTAQGQQAVQWRLQDGGNGHWYRVEVIPTGMTWSQAGTLAASRGGYLATITSAGEAGVVKAVVGTDGPWFVSSPAWGSLAGPWLGGSRSHVGGPWNWGTGEPWSFTAWCSNQPSGSACAEPERFLHVKLGDFCGGDRWWGDISETANCLPELNGLTGMVMEWSADCNADGIVDYGQILQGQLPDTNANGVPDGCECATSPTLPACCTGDLNQDRFVNGADLGILLNAWGACPGTCPADFNRDGFVDGSDLGTLLGRWGGCP